MSRVDIGVTGGAPNLLGSLTAAARPLPENIDWQGFGTSHVVENCGLAWVWQACTIADAENPKPLNPGAPAVEFHPFLVEYNAASCDGIVTGADSGDLADRAKRGLAVRISRAIDYALSSSAPDGVQNESPNLPDAAVDVTPITGPGALVCTLAGLIQDAYACGATGELFIHAPAWTLPVFLANTLITQVGNVFKLGPHTVVFDQGFSNQAPTGVGSDPDVAPSPAAAAGEAWIYISGPVEVATGTIQVLDDTTGGVDTRQNRANVIAAEIAIYRFDPCCVFAALVSVC